MSKKQQGKRVMRDIGDTKKDIKTEVPNKVPNKVPKRFIRGKDQPGRRAKAMPGLNQTALAVAIGISRPHMSKILNGLIDPTLETLMKIRDALGMKSVDEVHAMLVNARLKRAG